METEFEDRQLQDILSKGRKIMPFQNFEDELMIEIHIENKRKHSVQKNIKLSWFFFIIGMLSGIALVIIPTQVPEDYTRSISSIPINIILLISLCLIILLFTEKLIKYSFFRK